PQRFHAVPGDFDRKRVPRVMVFLRDFEEGLQRRVRRDRDVESKVFTPRATGATDLSESGAVALACGLGMRGSYPDGNAVDNIGPGILGSGATGGTGDNVAAEGVACCHVGFFVAMSK